MTGGLIALVVALLAATAAGLALRRRSGKVHTVSRTPRALTSEALASGAPAPEALTSAVLGTGLGERATLVQFSTEFCAYCGPTREVLGEIASSADGVRVVEIDAAERMDLTRRLHVLSTPTVLVLDALGGITSRASGPQRKADLLAAVGAVVGAGSAS